MLVLPICDYGLVLVIFRLLFFASLVYRDCRNLATLPSDGEKFCHCVFVVYFVYCRHVLIGQFKILIPGLSVYVQKVCVRLYS